MSKSAISDYINQLTKETRKPRADLLRQWLRLRRLMRFGAEHPRRITKQ